MTDDHGMRMFMLGVASATTVLLTVELGLVALFTRKWNRIVVTTKRSP